MFNRNRFLVIAFMVVMVLVFSLVFVTPGYAQGGDAGDDAMGEVEDDPEPSDGLIELLAFLDHFLALIPVTPVAVGLIPVVVNLLKKYGIVKDGWAGIASGALNALFYGLVYVFTRFGAGEEFGQLVIEIGKIAPYFLAFWIAISGSERVHKLMTRLGMGYSFGATRSPLAGRAG